jgi:hypothetical protein
MRNEEIWHEKGFNLRNLPGIGVAGLGLWTGCDTTAGSHSRAASGNPPAATNRHIGTVYGYASPAHADRLCSRFLDGFIQ